MLLHLLFLVCFSVSLQCVHSFYYQSSIALETGEDEVFCAVISGDFAYFATNTDPGYIVKTSLNPSFRRIGSIPTEAQLQTALISSSGYYAYFGTVIALKR